MMYTKLKNEIPHFSQMSMVSMYQFDNPVNEANVTLAVSQSKKLLTGLAFV